MPVMRKFLHVCPRIGLCTALVFVCWDLKPVFYAIWSPFMFLVGYNDPRKPSNDHLHGVTTHLMASLHKYTKAPGVLTCAPCSSPAFSGAADFAYWLQPKANITWEQNASQGAA